MEFFLNERIVVRNSQCFLQNICITFFHSFPMWADHQDGVYFFEFCKYKDPVCSEFTAKQCIYFGVVFAFTYSVSAFITVGNHDLQFFTFPICPQLAAHCNFFNSVLHTYWPSQGGTIVAVSFVLFSGLFFNF